MDPALLSYLTAQQMVTQQLGFPLLQAGAVPMTIQASSLQPAAAPSQLIGMEQFFKPATIPTTASSELLLQLLNNNNFGTMSMAPQVTIAPPLAPVKQQPQPQPFLNIFEQLVAAQQASSMQHPLFLDHAATFAALSVQPAQQLQQQQSAAASMNLTGLMPPATVLPPTTVHQPLAVMRQAPTMQPATTILHQPTALLPKMPATVVYQSTVLHPQQQANVPAPATVLHQPTALRPQPLAQHATLTRVTPVTRIASPETATMPSAFRGVKPGAAAAVATQPAAPAAATPAAVVKLEVCSPTKSSPSRSDMTPSWAAAESAAAAAAGAVASTSNSASVDDDVESMMSGEEEERCRPEDVFAGRQRRADHIAFHRKMKALLKSLRGSDLVCKLCAVKVDRHDNAFKNHIADHANKGANQLECRYCGYETPSRVEMNIHMGERHPNGSERAYTDKRDHLKMIEIMYQCFAKVPRPTNPMPKKDPALVKPRMTRKRRLAAEEAAAAAAAATTAGAEEDKARADSFEDTIVRFCTETGSAEVACACGDAVPLNPSALLAHVKTLHAQYRCNDCSDVLDSSSEARDHTVRMHGGDVRTYAERFVDHLVVRSMQQRFMACFISKESAMVKNLSVRVLQNQMDDELEMTPKREVKEEDVVEMKEELAADIKEEPIEMKEEPIDV